MKSDPDMNFVHGLPEGESSQCHAKVGQNLHHFSSRLIFFRRKLLRPSAAFLGVVQNREESQIGMKPRMLVSRGKI